MKYCGHCGSAMPDDAVACPQCGTMVGGGPVPVGNSGSLGAKLKEKKNLLIGVGAALAVVILAIILLPRLFGGSYKTPVSQMISMRNSKKFDMEEQFVNSMGGYGKSELKKIYKILSSSDNFKDYLEDAEESFEDSRDEMKDEFGKNWKLSYKIEDKDKLDKDDLKDIKNSIKSTANGLIDWADQILDMDNSDLKDTADDMGLKKDDLKKMAEIAKDLGKKLKKAKVSNGYDLDVNIRIKGSDDEDDHDAELTVVKVDGKWVYLNSITSYSAISSLFYALGM